MRDLAIHDRPGSYSDRWQELGGEELSYPDGVRGAGRAFTLPAGWADASFG